MIKYRTKLIESNTHGVRGGSYLIKTLGDLTPPPPIACVPFGNLQFTPNGLMNQIEVDFGPQSASYEIQPMNSDGIILVDGDDGGEIIPIGMSSITMSVNDGPFVTKYLDNPLDAYTIIMSGNPNVFSEPPEDIPPQSIATQLQNVNGISVVFVIGALLAMEFANNGSQEDMEYVSEIHSDVFGTELDMLSPNALTGIVGLSSNGEMIGSTNNWNLIDIYNKINDLNSANSEIPTVNQELFVTERETKVTYKRTNIDGDVYNGVFNNVDDNELTVSSCSMIGPEKPTYSCIPTVKTFTPTVGVSLVADAAAFVVRVRIDKDWGGGETSTYYVNRVITSMGLDGNFGFLDGITQMYYLDPSATPADVFKLLFGVFDLRTEGSQLDASVISGVSGIGEDNNMCNLLTEYDEVNNVGTISGIFDEAAVVPEMPFGIMYTTKYPFWRNVYAEPSVTKITLEMVDDLAMPAYAKCYITEQFGEEIVLDSCLLLTSNGGMSNT